MQLFVDKLVGSAVQIVLFSLPPLIWWLAAARKRIPFLRWLGLRKVRTENGRPLCFWCAGLSLVFVLQGGFMLWLLRGVETAASEFSGLGARAVPAVLVYAALNTALPEEIVFRGFLLKRLQNKTGFGVANGIQAVLFGVLHGLMFASLTGAAQLALIVVFTGVIAWCMGYVNEKKAGGSILPSWTIHTASNLFSGLCSAFLLL